MSFGQFIVSISDLIMLSGQQIISYSFHNMRVTWLFYYFLKLEVHILHRLKIFQFLKLGNCDLSDVTLFSVK